MTKTSITNIPRIKDINGTRKSLNSSSLVVDALIIIFVVISIFPAFSSIATEITIGISVLLVPIILTKLPRFSNNVKRCCLLSFLYFAIVCFYYLAEISNSNFSIVGNYLDWIIGIVVCLYYFETSTQKEKDFFLRFCFIAFNVSMLIVLIQSKTYNGVDLADIANASYSTLLMLFSGCCFVFLLNSRGKIIKLLVLISLALSIYVNFFILQRGTNILLTIVMFFLILIFRVESSFFRTLFVLLIVSLAFFVFNSNLIDNVFTFLSSHFDVTRIQERVYTILNFLKSGDYQNAGVRSFSYRVEYFFNSLKSFSNSPIFGVGDHRDSYDIIGNHSEIIDNFGRYGIVGGSVFLVVMLLHISILWKKGKALDNNIRLQLIVIPIIYLLRNVFGVAIGSTFSIMFFLFIPFMIEFLSENKIRSRRIFR